MKIGQSTFVAEKDPLAAIREAEADGVQRRRSALNQEMMRLPIEERRRRWNEYYARLDDLMKKSSS